jgi:hypothetical protein
MNWSKSAWVCSPRAIGGQHLVQVAEHVLDPLHRLRVGVLHDLPHAAELAVQYVAAQQVLELLEGLAGGGRAPVVVGQLPDRLGRVGGQRVEVGLAHPGLVARVGEQLGALLPDGRVEQGASLFEDAVEAPAAADLALPFPRPPQHVVEAAAAGPVAEPRRSSSRSASAGLAPASIASPISSTAPRTSNGSASGSGP